MNAPRRPALFATRQRPGMRLPAAADAASRPARLRIVDQTDDGPAELWLYDAIGEDFFGYGVNAESLCRDIGDLAADEILLRVNSPGGDYFDGIAIYNALVSHPAKVAAQVDGLAASAASFIIQAADRVVVGRGARLMIHDAIGYCVGNAADMQAMQDTLDSISADIADLYHAHSGGGAKAWRERMRAETWYSADESVAAGLADEVMPAPKKRGQDKEAAAASADWSPAAQWDLSSIFRYPDPATSTAPAAAGRERIVASTAPQFVAEAGPELVHLPAGTVVAAAVDAVPVPEVVVEPPEVAAGGESPVVVDAVVDTPAVEPDPQPESEPAASAPVVEPEPGVADTAPPEPDPEPAPEPEPAAEPVPAVAAAFPAGRGPAVTAEPAPDPWAALTEHLTVSRPATVDDLLAALREDATP